MSQFDRWLDRHADIIGPPLADEIQHRDLGSAIIPTVAPEPRRLDDGGEGHSRRRLCMGIHHGEGSPA